MNQSIIDTSRCNRPEKEEIAGICLSYDMVRGLCLETMLECDAMLEGDEETDV